MNELKGLRDKWQKRLNLCNWDIRIKFGKFEKPDQQGSVSVHSSEDIAEITIVKKKHYDWIEPYDIESLILHEMLHIVFEISPTDDTFENIIFERGLNRIVRLLLKLDRLENNKE